MVALKETFRSVDNSLKTVASMNNITKCFGDNTVLNNVEFAVRPGEVHALLGGNGAGKSTLMKILIGVHKPDSGTIHVNGSDITGGSIQDHMDAGIAMIYQELSLMPNLTVSGNIWFGYEITKKGWRIDNLALRKRTDKLFEHYGFSIPSNAKVENLSFSQRQVVEIAKAVSKGARVLIMDEPTSSLTAREEDKLFSIIDDLKGRSIGIIYITHRLSEIFKISDRITILRDGNAIGPLNTKETDLTEVTKTLVGQESRRMDTQDIAITQNNRFSNKSVVLEVIELSTKRKFNNISLNVKSGEIVGIAGLVGSGRSTLAKAIAGLLPDTVGTVKIDGKDISLSSTKAPFQAGLGFVPEDRHIEGLVTMHSIGDNIALPNLGQTITKGRFGTVSRKRIVKLYKHWKKNLSIDAKGVKQPSGELSGGNQQKVVFSKWMAGDLRILILDEPTAGVDVSAKHDFREAIREITKDDVGVLLFNSELEELLAIADRIMIMAEGQIESPEEIITSVEELQRVMQAFSADLRGNYESN